jgi:hypothetical protein
MSTNFKPFKPLDKSVNLPQFPVDMLPEKLANYATEVAKCVQCEPDMPATAILCAIACVSSRKALVGVGNTHTEPVNLWSMIVADPSERKSEVFGKVFAPVYKYQSDTNEKMREEFERQQMDYKLHLSRIASLEKKYASAKQEKIEEIRYELQNLIKDTEAMEPMFVKRYTAGDVTPEAMATIMHENGGSITVVDSEGAGPLANALGRYGDAGTKLENMLRSYRGDTMQIDRRGRSETIFKPSLTVALALQHGVLARMGKHNESKDQGFTARFLYSIPKSNAGTRFYADYKINQYVQNEYNSLVERIAEIPSINEVKVRPEIPIMQLQDDALAAWTSYHDEIEKAMGGSTMLAKYRDFSGKLAGQVARLSGLFHIVEHGADAIGHPMPAYCVGMAVEIVRSYYQPHGLEAYRIMFEANGTTIAHKILQWIGRHKTDACFYPIFSAADAYRNLRGSNDVTKPEDLREGFEALVDRGYIAECDDCNANTAGRPASTRYIVNTDRV